MKVKLLLGVAIAFIFIQCGGPSINNPTVEKATEDSCCVKNINKNEVAGQSMITCPECGHQKMETMPEDVCLLKYNCEKCQTELRPQNNDCCVFCSYGSHKCPSMQ
jgi:hypothetical protein